MSTETPLVTGVDFVVVPVTSLDTAQEFYEGVLGLPCTARFADIGLEFESGNLTIGTYDMARLGREFAPSTGAIAMQVDDVPAAREHLEGRGVRFLGDVVDSGHCHQAYFQDTDGNQLILHHRYEPAAGRSDA